MPKSSMMSRSGLSQRMLVRWASRAVVSACNRKNPSVCRGAPSLLRRLLAFLREQRLVAPNRKSIAGSPAQRLANEYRDFSMEKRGLDHTTIDHYSRHVQRFLDVHFGTGRVDLRTLGTSDICAFVRRQAPRGGRGLAS